MVEIERLVREALPRGVGVGVVRAGPDVPPLLPGEDQVLGERPGARRRSSFALGRAAAHLALRDLGVEGGEVTVPGGEAIGRGRGAGVVIGRGRGGEPLWPTGVVGAISHSGELAVAVVGRREDYAGLGIDLEQRSPGMSARGARLVCTPAEIEWTLEDPGPLRRTQVFSAKEAIFKALYPIERVWLGFGDAEVIWRAERGAFEARTLKAAGAGYPVGTPLEVPCRVTDAEILSVTWVCQA